MSETKAPKTTDHEEVEWQFDALDTRPVASWLENSNGAKISSSGEEEISDAYLDTDDWRVFRAGYALRVREKDGKTEATMKLIEASDDGEGLDEGFKKRREITEPLSLKDFSNLPKSGGPVGERIHSLAGRKSLKTLFEVHTKRKTYEAAFEAGGEEGVAGGDRADGEPDGAATTVAEVALDETEIPVEGGAPAVLRRVEVEIERGFSDALSQFVEELRRECRLTPSTASKFEAGLLAAELSPPEEPEFGPTEISSSMAFGEVAYAVMRKQFSIFLRHEPGTRIGEDSEELHDMRVAGRRARAAMQIFKDALPVRSKKLRGELKWISGVLGEVRDLDVQIESLEGWDSDPEAFEELRGVLEERRTKARKAMLRALDSRRYAEFVESYSAFLVRGPAKRSEFAWKPVREAAPELIRKRYRKFRKAGDDIEKDSSAGEYHELRKRGKRLRYALEFVSEIYGKPTKELTKALKNLQDVLGDHQDAEVAMSELRELALPAKSRRGGAISPRTVFAMGGISHRYETLVEELREEFPAAYGEIKGKRWKRLEKAMDEAGAEGGGG